MVTLLSDYVGGRKSFFLVFIRIRIRVMFTLTKLSLKELEGKYTGRRWGTTGDSFESPFLPETTCVNPLVILSNIHPGKTEILSSQDLYNRDSRCVIHRLDSTTTHGG